MLDRGVPTLPGSMKAPDRGLYMIRYIHIQNTNIPGPVHAGPWCAYTSGFGESSGPWLKHIDIYITLIYRVQYMLDAYTSVKKAPTPLPPEIFYLLVLQGAVKARKA